MTGKRAQKDRKAQKGEKKELFILTKDYIVAYWITYTSYILEFLILMLTIGYDYNSPLSNVWLKRGGLLVMIFGWLVWYIGRKKLGHESIDIDPLGEIARILFHFGAQKPPRYKKPLVTDGIYAITRHPQYWGTVLFYIGLAIALESIPGLIGAFVIVLPAHIWRAKVEEKMMIKYYGKKYIDYMQKVKI